MDKKQEIFLLTAAVLLVLVVFFFNSQLTGEVIKLERLLVAHYTFDIDVSDSARDNNAKIKGDADVFNNYLKVDLTNGYLELPIDKTRLGSVTIWINPKTLVNSSRTTTYGYLFNLGEYKALNRLALFHENYTICLAMGGFKKRCAEDIILTKDKWQFLALTWDGFKYNIYEDGEMKFSGFYSGVKQSDCRRSTIGAWSNCGSFPKEYFDGLIDEVRIYERAISDAEVRRIYNLGR